MSDEMQITFTGTIDQIIDFAIRLNTGTKKFGKVVTQQSNNQPLPRLRYNNAWRMVVGCQHSIREIREKTGVCKGTVSNMRSVMADLSSKGKALPKMWK